MFENLKHILEVSELDIKTELNRVEAHLETIRGKADGPILRVYENYRDKLKQLLKQEGK
jgi:hypothetical protein